MGKIYVNEVKPQIIPELTVRQKLAAFLGDKLSFDSLDAQKVAKVLIGLKGIGLGSKVLQVVLRKYDKRIKFLDKISSQEWTSLAKELNDLLIMGANSTR